MKTQHRIHFADATDLSALGPESVHLVVTSPPYPMVEMWDGIFSCQAPAIEAALERKDGWDAFRGMHEILDAVWGQLERVLVTGGIACINIGDATRTIGGSFALYPNHSRILGCLLKLGFSPLPAILWRKQTNAPNKFMGSGMYPPGAYVTLEHEYILIARKGGKRQFRTEAAKQNRRQSAFFWEERNEWYSDVWLDLKGSRQSLAAGDTRARSGAFPFELPYRLINMFSVKGDTVLDPFLGVGTTLLAAMATGRDSIGYEVDRDLEPVIHSQADGIVPLANARVDERLSAHAAFIKARYEAKGRFGYANRHYGFPVVTRQEVDLLLDELKSCARRGAHELEVDYAGHGETRHTSDWTWFFEDDGSSPRRAPAERRSPRSTRTGDGIVQLDLLS